ncbi:laccase domain-containing protein [Desulfovibrio sp.]
MCTFANSAFYSYRRNHACGRQASLIWTTVPAQADA